MVLILLAVIGFVGGVGITAVGPGGVLPTIGLFALTGLSPAEVAGTSIVTHIATGVVATAAFTRSGQLRDPDTRRTAWTLAGTALVGTPVGVLINAHVSERTFGVVLGVIVAGVAGLVVYRDQRHAHVPHRHPSTYVVAILGVGVAVLAGIVGIGGPMLTVPLLVVLGVPLLESLAAAQAQSIVIASTGTVAYATNGSIDWALAALIGIPELAGVLVGWRLARKLPTRTLKIALVATLLALSPYLALRA
ncbi:sulfite exporter TauE/SafE family protein [Nocardioidaceae bacterium SCSIO 66511]|nr:sulfite exporter TauE/SafE family protein [Nocardioidaceae bacterium SCSIO 66511]